MKTIAIGLAVAAAALAGCTSKHTTIEQPAAAPPAVVYQAPAPVVVAPPPNASPRIAYTVMGESQFNQAAVQAANWCNTNHYGAGASLIDRQRTTGGDVVTFACTAS